MLPLKVTSNFCEPRRKLPFDNSFSQSEPPINTCAASKLISTRIRKIQIQSATRLWLNFNTYWVQWSRKFPVARNVLCQWLCIKKRLAFTILWDITKNEHLSNEKVFVGRSAVLISSLCACFVWTFIIMVQVIFRFNCDAFKSVEDSIRNFKKL